MSIFDVVSEEMKKETPSSKSIFAEVAEEDARKGRVKEGWGSMLEAFTRKAAGVAAPYMPAAGGIAGGLAAIPAAVATLPTGAGPILAEAGGIAGGTLLGQQAKSAFEEYAGTKKPPATIGEAFKETARNVPEALQAGAMGPIGSKVIGGLVQPLAKTVAGGFTGSVQGAKAATTAAAEQALISGGSKGIVKAATTGAVKGVGTGLKETAKREFSQVELVRDAREIAFAVKKGMGSLQQFGKKTSYKQIQAQQEVYTKGVENLVRRKGQLSFEDEGGQVITGEVPQSIGQGLSAAGNHQDLVFKQFDAMQKAAGKAGAEVSLEPAANAVAAIKKGQANETFFPEIIAYANKRLESMKLPKGTPPPSSVAQKAGQFGGEGVGYAVPTAKGIGTQIPPQAPTPTQWKKFSPEDAQDAIKMFNANLKTYMDNPTYEAAGKVYVDAVIAKAMRAEMDAVITKASGPGYQALKSEYGAAKELEKAFLTKFKQMAKKDGTNSLVNITDIYSVGEILTGMATGHPLMIAKGAAFAAAKKTMQSIWSPDAQVAKMFKKVDRIIHKVPQERLPFTKTKGGLAGITVGASLEPDKGE